ncbi:hypothetical protein D3C78_1433560 [compost metagenome]
MESIDPRLQFLFEPRAVVRLAGIDDPGSEHYQTAADSAEIHPLLLIRQGHLRGSHHRVGMAVTHQHGRDPLATEDTGLALAQALVQPGVAVVALRLDLGDCGG